MLFDLRSRGRRRTVRVIYLGLALLMGGGLVLFGVGTGNGNGGLLNGLSNSGSNSAQHQVVDQQERAALSQVKANPHSAAAWGSLVEAYWSTANQSPDLNSSTGVYSAVGRRRRLGERRKRRVQRPQRLRVPGAHLLRRRADEQGGPGRRQGAVADPQGLAL